MTRQLFGLTGVAGAGKDTAAMLMTYHGGYYQYAFAKPLKQALACMGINEPSSREDKEKLLPGKPYSYRTAAQTLGTEWARNLDPDFWLKLAEAYIVKHDRVVISDVRFENEADMIRKSGGKIVHVVGRQTSITDEKNKVHASERALAFKDSDLLLDNSGSITDLTYRVHEILRSNRKLGL